VTRLLSFDGTQAVDGTLATPERAGDLLAILDRETPCAIRGSGLSYCMASGGDGVTSVATKHFDRILAFDRTRRLVTVEAGMSIGALLDFALTKDCSFPVLPGYPTITVGGCVAFNVHGKTQHNVGHFFDHVAAVTLVHPDHGEMRCDREIRPELFELTIGGMGLTGYIADVTLRLQPLRHDRVARIAHPVSNVWEAVELMEALAANGSGLYSWNDLNARKSAFGRGFVYEERFVDGERRRRRPAGPARPGARPRLERRRAPIAAYTNVTSAAINGVYRLRDRVRPTRVTSVLDAAFPIVGHEIYFRLFGPPGFLEYQMVIPSDAWPTASLEIQRAVETAGVPVTLGSCKLFRGTQRHLWFAGDGVCLAIDVPNGSGGRSFFATLDAIAIAHNAPVNLSKDSRIAASTVEAIFPAYAEFASALECFDRKRRFDSALRRRIGV
jgi:decaprenylphospho-beta-D-ribofuranose 2-oxidase